mgnify:CR=1 FL=1
MSSKSETHLESFIKALRRGIKGYADYPEKYQGSMAKLIWEEGLNRREHRRRDGWITIGYKELERGFGRNGFKAMNTALGIFEVSSNWHWRGGRPQKQNATKGYRLMPLVQELKAKYLKPRLDRMEKLIYLDGKDEFRPLKSVPNPIAAKEGDDELGVTATAWRNAKPFNKIPVDLNLLKELYEYLTRMRKPENLSQDDLFLRSEAEDIERRIEWVGQLIRLAQTDVAGRGFIIHRYAEYKTGRLYATGVSLQTAPRIIRKAALHGLYDYDIENCHFDIFEQLASRFGYQAQAIRHYLNHKDEVREGIASRVGIKVKQGKMALLALMFGARDTGWHETAIPRELGKDKARELYPAGPERKRAAGLIGRDKSHELFADREFAAIAKDVQAGRDVILKAWPKRRTTLINDMGKPVNLKAKPEVRMAHIIQGIEAKAIRAAIGLYPDDIVLLMHDGFVTTRQIDAQAVERRIFDETTFRLRLSGGVIELPADLEFAKL